jgi:hypothetical protein
MSLQDLEELCVTRFATSRTRHTLLQNFCAILQRIVGARIDGEVWVDGSFLTEKIDPGDIDFFVNIAPHYYESGTGDQTDIIEWLIARENEPKTKYRCDCDVGIVYPEESPDRYIWEQVSTQWRRLFGFSVKAGEPKGIALLRLGEIRL